MRTERSTITSSPARVFSQGMSLVEILTTIAIVGILTAGALAAFSHVKEGSKNGVAQDLVNHLNNSLASFTQTNYEMVRAAAQDSAADELDVLTTLQWRHPNPSLAEPGSPYVTPFWDPETSDDTATYRVQWNGKVFEVLRPGAEGAGIKIDFSNGATGQSDQGRQAAALASYTTHPPVLPQPVY